MEYPKLTFTLTSGRRLDLFIKTMDSFLVNCKDQDLIERWICVDDRSSKEDLEVMKQKYRFMEFYSSNKPGQAASLNLLFSKVNTEWIFHCEDDWLFIKPDNFIRKCFEIVNDNQKIKEVTLRYWQGTLIKHNCLTYWLHIFNPNGNVKGVDKCNWGWWGYTLNPSLQHFPTIMKWGMYDENKLNNREWDRKVAIPYWKEGFKVANLDIGGNKDFKYIKHLGKERALYEN